MNEIVKCFCEAITSLACEQRRREDERPDEQPANAKAFPGSKIGDFLYHCGDLEEGVVTYLVVQLLDGGFVRVVTADPTGRPWSEGRKVWLSWGVDWMFASEAEALTAAAESDVRHFTPRLELARKVLAAVKCGGDLSPYRGGVSLDD